MPPSRSALSTTTRALRTPLWFLAAAIAMQIAIEWPLLVENNAGYVFAASLFPCLALVYAAVGLFAWWRRPSNRLGALLVMGSFFWLLSALDNVSSRPLIAVGEVTALLPFAFTVHLILVFPTGRTIRRGARTVVALAYVTALVFQIPLYAFGAIRPDSPLLVADRPDLANLGQNVQATLGSVVVLLTAALVIRRYRTSPFAVRRALAPVAAYGLVALSLVLLSARVIRPLLGIDPITLFEIQGVVLGLVPVAAVLGMLRGGFARTGELLELGVMFRPQRDRSELTAVLADAVGDPSVQLTFWLEPQREFVDADGRLVRLPQPGSGRATSTIVLDGHLVGAIVYDETQISDPGLVTVAGQALALGLDRQRLTVELLRSREDLRESRLRIVEADESVRRRLARDLHDSLQGRLVMLAILAQRLTNDLAADPRQERAAQVRTGLDVAIAEMRDVVANLMPALLIERGLPAAVLEVVDRMPVPTRLTSDPRIGRLPATVESAAFFVVAEALANGVKHAGAQQFSISLDLQDGELHLAVVDDGIGGAVARDGGGLRGLSDRVEALGGRMALHSPPQRGTRLEAWLPCVS